MAIIDALSLEAARPAVVFVFNREARNVPVYEISAQ